MTSDRDAESLADLLTTASVCLHERGLDDLSDAIDEATSRLQTAERERDEARKLLGEQSRRIDAWQLQSSENDTRAQSAEAALLKAREALEPFAAFARSMPDAIPDTGPATQGSPLARKQVTFGDFRRAAQVLSELEGMAVSSSSSATRLGEVERHTKPEPSTAWVLVPREPTREMWEASGNAVNAIGHRFKLSGHHDRYSTSVWEAMLASAPPADADLGAELAAVEDFAAIAEWIGLSASALKSGEPYTDTCLRVHQRACDALDRLQQRAPNAPSEGDE